MAKRHIVELVDDLDQTLIDDSGGTNTFALNGRTYEIDLTAANAHRLEEALAPFVDAARRVSSGSPTPSRGSARARTREETDAIRAWAREHGHAVSDRGRISETIISAYRSSEG